jgi:hypothetical protein
MPENNNIDKLFQDKLNGLQASPNPRVWAAIENKMAPKRRRVVPFWWISGVAAVFILGVFLFPFYDNQEVSAPNNSFEEIVTTKEKETILKNIDKTLQQEKEETQFVENQIKKEKNQNFNNKKQVKQISKQKKEMSGPKIAMEEKVFPKNLAKNENQENENKVNHQQEEQTIVSSSSTKKQTKNISETKPSKDTAENKKIFVLEENGEENRNDKKRRKIWSISTNLALLNSGSFSNSSPFSENLVNSTRGRNSLAYGVQIGFSINKKWSIRSGLQLQELNYQNNNVLVTTAGSDVAAVSFDGIPEASIESVSNSSALADSFESSGLRNTNSVSGNLSQQFGYIEIPIEVKYTLNDNDKLQTQLVGGFSSLFLRTNNVFLRNNFSNRSGDAPNLNNINFSSNLGVDFNYQFSKNWSFSVNPMLKTFLNTFSGEANGFSPFNLGLYSGLRYQF